MLTIIHYSYYSHYPPIYEGSQENRDMFSPEFMKSYFRASFNRTRLGHKVWCVNNVAKSGKTQILKLLFQRTIMFVLPGVVIILIKVNLSLRLLVVAKGANNYIKVSK